MFANQTMFWGNSWFERVCEVTRLMIRELEKLVPLAEGLMDMGVLPMNAFVTLR